MQSFKLIRDFSKIKFQKTFEMTLFILKVILMSKLQQTINVVI